MKKFLLSLFLLGLVTCSETPNDFSPDANTFLDAINGKTYKGQGFGEGHRYEADGTVIADHPKNPTTTLAQTLIFVNTRDSGASATEGVYRIRLKGGTLGEYVGIIIENSGGTLKRTSDSVDEVSINWAYAPVFAKQEE